MVLSCKKKTVTEPGSFGLLCQPARPLSLQLQNLTRKSSERLASLKIRGIRYRKLSVSMACSKSPWTEKRRRRPNKSGKGAVTVLLIMQSATMAKQVLLCLADRGQSRFRPRCMIALPKRKHLGRLGCRHGQGQRRGQGHYRYHSSAEYWYESFVVCES